MKHQKHHFLTRNYTNDAIQGSNMRCFRPTGLKNETTLSHYNYMLIEVFGNISKCEEAPSLKNRISNYKKQRLSTPLKRGSSTIEICSTIKYFADNPSVSGQLICVDGGQNLQAIKKTEEIDQ